MDVCNVAEQQAGQKTVEFVESYQHPIPMPSFLLSLEEIVVFPSLW